MFSKRVSYIDPSCSSKRLVIFCSSNAPLISSYTRFSFFPLFFKILSFFFFFFFLSSTFFSCSNSCLFLFSTFFLFFKLSSFFLVLHIFLLFFKLSSFFLVLHIIFLVHRTLLHLLFLTRYHQHRFSSSPPYVQGGDLFHLLPPRFSLCCPLSRFLCSQTRWLSGGLF